MSYKTEITEWGCIKRIKSESKDIYKTTKYLYFK